MNSIPTTTVQPVEHKYPVEPTVSAAGKAFNDTADFTKKVALFEVAPFLLGGIAFACADNRGIGSLLKILGPIMIVASPLILVVKAIALPVLAGSAVATAAIGVVYGAEKLLTKPDAEKQRLEHTQHFVLRMKEWLNTVPAEQKAAAMENPGNLIALTLLTVVFLSRKLKGDQIKDGKDVIHDVAKMDPDAQAIFAKVCRMKSYLGDLNLGLDDSHAWEILTTDIQNYYKDKSLLQLSLQTALENMIRECDELSALIVKDEIFQTAWKKA